MKSTTFCFLSILLVVAILAPSIVTLVDREPMTELVMDFNEEDNKNEEKKEKNEKDFFVSFQWIQLSYLKSYSSKKSSPYFEKNYFFSNTIFLPPPERPC